MPSSPAQTLALVSHSELISTARHYIKLITQLRSEIENIFERFHRVEKTSGRTIEGTGVGLALTAETVKSLGGTVDVRSEVGVGSTFTVSVSNAQLAVLARLTIPAASARLGTCLCRSLLVASSGLLTSKRRSLPSGLCRKINLCETLTRCGVVG